MHHRRDGIPVWIILFFFDAGRSTHVGFLSVPVIRFPPFQPCVTRARILSPYFSSISTSPPLLSPLAASPGPMADQLHRYEATRPRISYPRSDCPPVFPPVRHSSPNTPAGVTAASRASPPATPLLNIEYRAIRPPSFRRRPGTVNLLVQMSQDPRYSLAHVAVQMSLGFF